VTHGFTSITWIRILLALAVQTKGVFGNVESKNHLQVGFNGKKG
jgi:hypothetical protein